MLLKYAVFATYVTIHICLHVTDTTLNWHIQNMEKPRKFNIYPPNYLIKLDKNCISNKNAKKNQCFYLK